tara:strand:+ start:79 stop:567 length:489 start_codon:yes stop_codon:yes gene_type:complete
MKIKLDEKLPITNFFYLDKEDNIKKIKSNEIYQNESLIVIGVPGAFTKVCSTKHLPGYVSNYDEAKKKGVTKIVCVSVNDPNVMKAWGEHLNVQDKIFMAADPFCEFTKAIGAEVDKSIKGLGLRSERYTMHVVNGLIKKIKVEENTAKCEISAAENFIKDI